MNDLVTMFFAFVLVDSSILSRIAQDWLSDQGRPHLPVLVAIHDYVLSFQPRIRANDSR